MRAIGVRAACLASLAAASSCGNGVGVPIRLAVTVAPKGEAGSVAVAAPSAVPDAGDAAAPSAPDAGRVASSDVPNTRYCASVAQWPPDLASEELALFDLINRPRGGTGPGASCGSRGPCANVRPLLLARELRCSTRRHSEDMATQHYFAKTDPNGTDPGTRIARAGITTSAWGECIVEHAMDANGALQQLVNGSDPQAAANFNNPQFTAVGVGHYGDLWTIDFAR